MGGEFLTSFTPLEIMPRSSAARSHFRIIPVEFNAPLEFLTGFILFVFLDLVFYERQEYGFDAVWIDKH